MEDVKEFISAEELQEWSRHSREVVEMQLLEADVMVTMATSVGLHIGYDDDDNLYTSSQELHEHCEQVSFERCLERLLKDAKKSVNPECVGSEAYIFDLEYALLSRYFATNFGRLL